MKTKSDYYYEKRWDLFSLVPTTAKNILDIGCGNGWLGKQLKITRECNVIGVEVSDAGKAAVEVYDQVLNVDIENSSLPFDKKSFDCIILGDVLEHLADPWETLSKLVDYIDDNGVIVISVPNIGHYTIILSLLLGHFQYTEEGILDKTHLRFFTLESLIDMLASAGLQKIELKRNTSSGRIMRIANFLTFGLLDNLICFQYLVLTKKRNNEHFKK